jgi:hypothetical protein
MVPGGGGRCGGERGGGAIWMCILLGSGADTRGAGIILFSNARNPILECSILLRYWTA